MRYTTSGQRLTFAAPVVGGTAILPQQASVGTVAKIKQTASGYFNVTVQAVAGGAIRFYTVRRAGRFEEGTTEGHWIVERPGHGKYIKITEFRPSRQRQALEYAVRNVTVDWLDEVGNAA